MRYVILAGYIVVGNILVVRYEGYHHLIVSGCDLPRVLVILTEHSSHTLG